jgi:hypothetical protein
MTDLKKQSLRCLAHRFVSAQNAQIWTGPYLDGLKPTSAHIGGYARGCRRMVDHALRSAFEREAITMLPEPARIPGMSGPRGGG